MSGLGGGSAPSVSAGGAAGTTSGTFNLGLTGQKGIKGFDGGTTTGTSPPGGASFWGGSYGAGGDGPTSAGIQGLCLILEW
jgi:hypothetical protein